MIRDTGGRLLAAALLFGAAAACDPRRPPPAEEVAPEIIPSEEAVPDTALSAVIRRGEAGAYAIRGRTRAAPTVELTVEDGHFVLFGPAALAVENGEFATTFRVRESDMETVYAYLTEPTGRHQWVVPIPLADEIVRWGPEADRLPAPPDPEDH